ncbi:MBL fold metallo-hydrolase [Frankia sp. CNm7]|uniref:Linear primary-alkylsulfatase n=1 Tax=Frankia nepalensis TaxID=1836974 RepID=A0A937UPC1_9ACTN|nr:alkyl sulfatase dimerization domain-containing protein [Frankia nepalensis]MBL7498353.1 MBL fold metallo-hydrolase [Frankia nepalensis]MBL7513238.1 MBL fold metallo-hydrolase [Frankia nepalensis]MBL7524069.1 MBL fold metallo-hydrolase [Frankia nepalensis]MBL7628922.1 MBL fold metallo-hydrolase [Frankia nepalensis]
MVGVDERPRVSEPTRAVNEATARALPFGDEADFADARRGLIEEVRGLVVQDPSGFTSWDSRPYEFLRDGAAAPETVNPSLWRYARLMATTGLFEVAEGIYQVRGMDISIVTFIEGDTGVIVVDPLVTAGVARAALDLYRRHRGDRPVVAVIHSHSHADHYGGVAGVVDPADVAAGRVEILAPEGFLEHAVTENVFAGTAMSRRAVNMYGALLPKGPAGQVSGGQGLTNSLGAPTLIPPTRIIRATGERVELDGVRLVFQLVPDTEAPAEMNMHLPDRRALFVAETANATMHQLYTLRGAQVRDARAWARYLNETAALFAADSDVLFSTHSWPRWGTAALSEYLTDQADVYKYLHDQTLRLANAGYTMLECAEMIELPPRLAEKWYNRGYYGSVSHNVKAVWQRYLGWFDGNPANLHPLPPEPAGRRYTEMMGGPAAVVAKAEEYFDRGDYRWVLQVLNHVVFGHPDHRPARELAARACEQLAYQTENAPWRNFYLAGADELRRGVPTGLPATGTASADTARAMPVGTLLDYAGTRLDGPRAGAEEPFTLDLEIDEPAGRWRVEVRNGVLRHRALGDEETAGASVLRLTRSDLVAALLGEATLADLRAAGRATVHGAPGPADRLFGLLADSAFWWPIATP